MGNASAAKVTDILMETHVKLVQLGAQVVAAIGQRTAFNVQITMKLFQEAVYLHVKGTIGLILMG